MRLKSFRIVVFLLSGLGFGGFAAAHEVRPVARHPAASAALRVAPPAPQVRLAVRPHRAPVFVHGAFGPAYGLPLGYPLHGPFFQSFGYAPPPVVVMPLEPPTYIEQGDADVGAPAQGYWYWCAQPEGYYPDVPECSSGWQPVPPRPDHR